MLVKVEIQLTLAVMNCSNAEIDAARDVNPTCFLLFLVDHSARQWVTHGQEYDGAIPRQLRPADDVLRMANRSATAMFGSP